MPAKRKYTQFHKQTEIIHIKRVINNGPVKLIATPNAIDEHRGINIHGSFQYTEYSGKRLEVKIFIAPIENLQPFRRDSPLFWKLGENIFKVSVYLRSAKHKSKRIKY